MQYSEYSDSVWESLWLRQAKLNDVAALPVMVSEKIQTRLHGTSNVAAIQGALKFRKVLKQRIGRLSAEAKFLDFGCGWGRHIRVFLKDFKCENIYGVDIDPENIALLRKYLPKEINILPCYEGKPIALESGSFDLILSFSVFSHLNEDSALYWLNELKRLIKPGGYIVATSWGRELFEIFNRLKLAQGKWEYDWERNIDKAFDDKQKVRKLYDDGRFIFGRHGSTGDVLDPSVYGISLMPKTWIENKANLHVADWIEDTSIAPQTTFFLQKS